MIRPKAAIHTGTAKYLTGILLRQTLLKYINTGPLTQAPRSPRGVAGGVARSMFEKRFLSMGLCGLLVAGGMSFCTQMRGGDWKGMLGLATLALFLYIGTRCFKPRANRGRGADHRTRTTTANIRRQKYGTRGLEGNNNVSRGSSHRAYKKCNRAVKEGDVHTLRENINRLGREGQYTILVECLHEAVIQGYKDTLSWALDSELLAFSPSKHETYVGLNDDLPATPFLTILAPLVRGHTALATEFLQRYPNEMREHLESSNLVVNLLVYVAAWKGHLASLEWLEFNGFVDRSISVTAGQNLPPTISGMPPTPFFAACQYGCLPCCMWLYEHGAQSEPGGPNVDGFNPLYLACQSGSLETVKFVFAHGGRCNIRTVCANGGTPVMIAVEMGNLDVLEWLLENDWEGCRADVSQAGNQGCTPFFADHPGTRYCSVPF